MDLERLDKCVEEIRDEYIKAKRKFLPFYNLHEAYAIIKEELDEFWEVVRLNQSKNPDRIKKAREEAIQIAAMALGVVYEWSEEQ